MQFALAQGFFFNTCRRTSSEIFLTVRDGSYVKLCKSSSLQDSKSDYIIFTELGGSGFEGGLGLIKMASEISVDWVRDLIPKLRDDIDVLRLSGRRSRKPAATKIFEESKD